MRFVCRNLNIHQNGPLEVYKFDVQYFRVQERHVQVEKYFWDLGVDLDHYS